MLRVYILLGFALFAMNPENFEFTMILCVNLLTAATMQAKA